MKKEEIIAFSQGHAEPAWLTELRAKAFEVLTELSLPHIERVNFERWHLDEVKVAESSAEGNVPTFTELPNYPLLVQVGSNTVLEQISPELADKGVIFTDFATALTEIPEIIEKNFDRLVKFDENSLTAANVATFNSGAVLYVPDNVEINEPVESIFYQDSESSVPFNKHLLIIVGKNAKLNYLERLQTTGAGKEKIKANYIVEVIADSGAQVKFSALDELGVNVTGFISRRSLIGDNATVDWSIGVMNDGDIIADFDSELRGQASHSNIKAVGISTGKQTQGVNTRVTNYGKNSIGHILQNGVILDSGTLTLNGIGHIIHGASGADAQQSSRVLMLSDSARGDANPILLIDENDVTAGHAASIGQIDPEDLYYLQSRGLDEDTAKRLVIRGFLGAVVTEIPVKSVRDEFITTIERKLGM
ncbi:Fe-S cluster assembly protein SufD [Lactococcus nasutitermitis]|uniref:Fe-S cluster assembly protein SufD n=1 Tax=Lactococcus nasutitermitis TaxID=1652957 RepID=A0ABV9JCG6_9LACT|nr:Fe-S cluster assembly protein SufD [Lactococcus nasutitermitis]